MAHTRTDILNPPTTIGKAADRLLLILTPDELHSIAAMQFDNLIDPHFTFGKLIRNGFGHHNENSQLLAARGNLRDPDDVSQMIICNFWQRLQNSNGKFVALPNMAVKNE